MPAIGPVGTIDNVAASVMKPAPVTPAARQLANLGVQRLHVDRRLRRFAMAVRPEDPRCAFQQLAAPDRDLVRLNVELPHQLGQRLFALHGSQGHLRLEDRAVVPACSLRHLISCSAAMLAAYRQKLHLAACPDLPSQRFTG